MSQDKSWKTRVKDKISLFFDQFTNDYNFAYRGRHVFAHRLIWFSFLCLGILILWSAFATIDEVAVANGKVIPSKQIQLIQNLEGGIVKSIIVKPGQMVKQGEVLAYLDETKFNSDYVAANKKWIVNQIKLERLKAEANKLPFQISDDLKNADPAMYQSENQLYQSRLNQMNSLNLRKSAVQKEIDMTAPLVKTGAVSKVDLLRLDESKNEIQGQIDALISSSFDELSKTKSELDVIHQDMLAAKDRLNRTTIRSPVNGVINQVYVTTVGGVLKPADHFIDIVPLDDTLLVEAKLRPADIGFISLGQQATVKVSAYDFSIYGGLEGKIEQISADTIKDDKGELYYQIQVRTDKNYIQTSKRQLAIIPGMTATVDILTGKKTVLDYLLKPILKARQIALRER